MKFFTIFFLTILTQFSCKSHFIKEKRKPELQESTANQLILDNNITVPHDQETEAHKTFLLIIAASFLVCIGFSFIKSKNRIKKSS